jgi:hypothetical protein
LPLIVLRIILLLLSSTRTITSSTITSSTITSTITSSTISPPCRRLLWMTTLLSPWTISSFSHILQQLASPLRSLYSYHQGRFRVLPEAHTILQECLQDGRATWNRHFVVFWPEPTTTTTTNTSTTTAPTAPRRGIWIIPGALVPHIAYAPIAQRLSKAGFVVVIQSLEPTRLAQSKLLTTKQLQKYWNDASRIFPSNSNNININNTTNIQWNLIGHSMGSFYCMKLAQVLPSTTSIHKVVLWGMASFLPLCTDLSDATTDILVIQASDDALRDMTQQYHDEFQQCFPQHMQQRTISGGTHHGFASYQAPTRSTSISSTSSAAGMTHEEQQALACEWTVQFLSDTTTTRTQSDNDNDKS